MICSDAPGTGGLHVGAPAQPGERKLARRATGGAMQVRIAPWTALAVGCVLATGVLVLGWAMLRRGA